MELHSLIESRFAEQAEGLVVSAVFRYLENGYAPRRDYDRFIANLCRTHLKSPQILAFLFSISPPASAEMLKHNMLEELGLDDTEGVSHPAMLLQLAAAAGFDLSRQAELEREAQEELRQNISEPFLFETLKELGLSVLLQTTAFEWMLSRTAGRMAQFLLEHRKLSHMDLQWFHHHAEVDIRHAEEGLEAVVDHVEFYEFGIDDLEILLEVSLRENIFIRRYFQGITLPTRTVAAD